jgi:hypothetical protein
MSGRNAAAVQAEIEIPDKRRIIKKVMIRGKEGNNTFRIQFAEMDQIVDNRRRCTLVGRHLLLMNAPDDRGFGTCHLDTRVSSRHSIQTADSAVRTMRRGPS